MSYWMDILNDAQGRLPSQNQSQPRPAAPRPIVGGVNAQTPGQFLNPRGSTIPHTPTPQQQAQTMAAASAVPIIGQAFSGGGGGGLPASSFGGNVGGGGGSRGGGGGGGGGGISAAQQAAYQWALDQFGNAGQRWDGSAPSINFRDEGLLRLLGDTSAIDKNAAAQRQAVANYQKLINDYRSQGEAQLKNLLGQGQSTLKGALGRLDQRHATATQATGKEFDRAAQALKNIGNQYGAYQGAIGNQVNAAAQGFGFDAPQVGGGLQELMGALQGVNATQRAGFQSAMADRSSVYGGLDFDISNQLQSQYGNYMAQLQQQAMAGDTQAQNQLLQITANQGNQTLAAQQAAAQAGYGMNMNQQQYDAGNAQAYQQWLLSQGDQAIQTALQAAGQGISGLNMPQLPNANR